MWMRHRPPRMPSFIFAVNPTSQMQITAPWTSASASAFCLERQRGGGPRPPPLPSIRPIPFLSRSARHPLVPALDLRAHRQTRPHNAVGQPPQPGLCATSVHALAAMASSPAPMNVMVREPVAAETHHLPDALSGISPAACSSCTRRDLYGQGNWRVYAALLAHNDTFEQNFEYFPP